MSSPRQTSRALTSKSERKMRHIHIRLVLILTAAAVGGRMLSAKDKHPKVPGSRPQDQISIEAHIPAADGPVIGFIATKHYARSYVYAERAAGKPVTLIDVTSPEHPQVLSDTSLPASSLPASSGKLLAVAGTAALAGDAPVEKAPAAQTIRVMDFSDPGNPKITKQFEGVTAVEKVGNIILLANADGIWILSQHLAEDPAAEKRYANKVIYGESMY